MSFVDLERRGIWGEGGVKKKKKKKKKKKLTVREKKGDKVEVEKEIKERNSVLMLLLLFFCTRNLPRRVLDTLSKPLSMLCFLSHLALEHVFCRKLHRAQPVFRLFDRDDDRASRAVRLVVIIRAAPGVGREAREPG